LPGQYHRSSFSSELRRDVLNSHAQVQSIKLKQLQEFDLPFARFQSLFFNSKRDSKTKPFEFDTFLTYRAPNQDTSKQITAATAAVLLSLQAEEHLHPLLLACWQDVLSSATEHEPMPDVRALVSEDEQVWVIAPQWEGANIRGLVCVGDYIHGPILLRDIDRSLMTYKLNLPHRPAAAAGWLESGLLLVPAT